jgi:hypothetical protein
MPRIVVGGKGLAETMDQAWAALLAANSPPVLYRQGDVLVRVAKDAKTGGPCLRVMNHHRMRLRLARVAEWVSSGKGGLKPVFPPPAVVDAMLADDDAALPVLRRIVSVPVFAPNGRLLDATGYDVASGILYLPPEGLNLPAVPVVPSEVDVVKARELVLEMFCDFKFVGAADRAAAVALLLTAFARGLVDGPVPMFHGREADPGDGRELADGLRRPRSFWPRHGEDPRGRLRGGMAEAHHGQPAPVAPLRGPGQPTEEARVRVPLGGHYLWYLARPRARREPDGHPPGGVHLGEHGQQPEGVQGAVAPHRPVSDGRQGGAPLGAHRVQRADDETAPIRAFLAAWWKRDGTEPSQAKDLLPLALAAEVDVSGKTEQTEHAQKIKMGLLLKNERDRRYRLAPDLEVCISGQEDAHDKVCRWQLTAVTDASGAPNTPPDTPHSTPRDNSAKDDALRSERDAAGCLSLAHEKEEAAHSGGAGTWDAEIGSVGGPSSIPQQPALPATVDPDDPRNDLLEEVL